MAGNDTSKKPFASLPLLTLTFEPEYPAQMPKHRPRKCCAKKLVKQQNFSRAPPPAFLPVGQGTCSEANNTTTKKTPTDFLIRTFGTQPENQAITMNRGQASPFCLTPPKPEIQNVLSNRRFSPLPC